MKIISHMSGVNLNQAEKKALEAFDRLAYEGGIPPPEEEEYSFMYHSLFSMSSEKFDMHMRIWIEKRIETKIEIKDKKKVKKKVASLFFLGTISCQYTGERYAQVIHKRHL